MANYTEDEQRLILRLYREYCQCKQHKFKITPEDKQVLMQHIKNIQDFSVYNYQGYVCYRRFALPYQLPTQTGPSTRTLEAGEGISSKEHDILAHIEQRIQIEALIDLWKGDIPDVCILFAAIVEAGFGAGLLPRPLNRGAQDENQVAVSAKAIMKQRKEDKIKAAKIKLRKELGNFGQHH